MILAEVTKVADPLTPNQVSSIYLRDSCVANPMNRLKSASKVFAVVPLSSCGTESLLTLCMLSTVNLHFRVSLVSVIKDCVYRSHNNCLEKSFYWQLHDYHGVYATD